MNVALARVSTREFLRERPTVFFSMVFPFLFLGLFALIGASGSGAGPTTGVTVDSPVDLAGVVSVAGGADKVSLKRLSVDELLAKYHQGELRVAVLDAGTARPTVITPNRNDELARAVAAEVGAGASVMVVEPTSRPLRFGLPAVLLLGLASLALFGTAAPLIRLRERGVLRMLRSTPISAGQLLLAHAPVRLAAIVGQVGAVWGLAVVLHVAKWSAFPLALTTSLLSAGVFMSLGFLCGGLFRKSETFSAISGGLLPILYMLSGVMIPIETLPGAVQRMSRFVPLSYMGDILRHDLIGSPLRFSRPLSYLVMSASTIVFTLLAARTFTWTASNRSAS